MIKLCRFRKADGRIVWGIYQKDEIQELEGMESISQLLYQPNSLQELSSKSAMFSKNTSLVAPLEGQEVWAAGVTYLRSKKARMDESEFSASAYDKVYEAPRPELFFKSLPAKVCPPGGPVGIRRDAKWNVPEPELALVINSRKELAGFTVGNDMSSRDIEGENLLYLPQAKIYKHSCALGPCVTLAASEAEARKWSISLQIQRSGVEV